MSTLAPRRLGLAGATLVLVAGLQSCGRESHVDSGPPVPWPTNGSFASALDAVVPDRLVRDRIPGAVVVLVEDGAISAVRGYGEAVTESLAPMAAGTVFQLASITKTVTTWGALRLVEEGRFDLDSPIEPRLTRWCWPPTTFDGRGVTLRRILSHTAGFSVHGYLGWPPNVRLPALEESLDGNNNGSGPVTLIQEPGTGFLYSGGGYTVLQLLVEEVTREPFATFMQREILAPLGMTQSSYEWREDLRGATAGAYGAEMERLPNYLFSEQAAASLYATGPDLARFVAASMSGPAGEPPGRGVLSPESVDLARSPAAATGGSYGLGVQIWPVSQGFAVGHGGANRGWKTSWLALPNRGLGLVVLTNGDNGQRLTDEVGCAWLQQLAGAVPAWCH